MYDEEVISYKDFVIRLSRDDYAESPTDWTEVSERQGNVSFNLYHRNYTLPNELDVDWDDFESMAEAAKMTAGDRPYKLVRWHEHSDISVSLTDNDSYGDFDSGCAGFIVGDTTDDIESYFNEWKQYIEGDVWNSYVYEPNPDGSGDDEMIDGMGGCYGYDYALDMAQSTIDRLVDSGYLYRHKVAKKAQELHI